MQGFQGIVTSFLERFSSHFNSEASPRHKTAWAIERLETRRPLAADLAVTGFVANGEDLVVQYDVVNESVTAFDVAVYRSSDGVAHDAELTRVRVSDSAMLAQGTNHELVIDAAFADVQDDYFLVVEFDADGEVAETSETNNERQFEGGVFRANDGTVHVHGTSASDNIAFTRQGTNLEIEFGGTVNTFVESSVTEIHVRSHGGDDVVSSDGTIDKGIWAFGGEGTDTLYGGYGDDYLDAGEAGAYGGETLHGGDGNDTLIGTDQTDYLYAGEGDDIVYGGYGDDYLYGEGGNDTLLGQEGDDSLYGGYGDDYLDGGSENDFTLDAGGQAGDEVIDRPSILNFLGTELPTNTWKFTGSISDDVDPAGLIVTFGGVIPASTTTTVKANGTFEIIVVFSAPPIGIATAVITDGENLTSDLATFTID